MNPLVLEGIVRLIELAAELAPGIMELIATHGELDTSRKAALIARVEAARAKVAAYKPTS